MQLQSGPEGYENREPGQQKSGCTPDYPYPSPSHPVLKLGPLGARPHHDSPDQRQQQPVLQIERVSPSQRAYIA